MEIDARTAAFERIELLWEPALLTRERVDRSTIPVGWHCYELEARYACDYGRPVRLADYIEENFLNCNIKLNIKCDKKSVKNKTEIVQNRGVLLK